MAWTARLRPTFPSLLPPRRSLHAVQRPFTNLRRRSHAAPSSRRQLATAAAAWTEAARAAGGDTLVGRAAAAADALNRRLPAVLLGVAAWAWVQPHVFLGFHPATWQGGLRGGLVLGGCRVLLFAPHRRCHACMCSYAVRLMHETSS